MPLYIVEDERRSCRSTTVVRAFSPRKAVQFVTHRDGKFTLVPCERGTYYGEPTATSRLGWEQIRLDPPAAGQRERLPVFVALLPDGEDMAPGVVWEKEAESPDSVRED